jgi:tripartite-type tricarboxylate transporter receptor subunit TctC
MNMKKEVAMKKFHLSCLVMLMIVGVMFCSTVSAADNWPTRPINLTVCYAAGGTTDLSARMLASIIEKSLGQKILTENKPGGAGVLTASLAAKQKPDGYNIFTLPTAAAVIAPHMQKLVYDPLKDLTPICQYATWHFGLVVKADSPFKSFDDLIQYAKKHPGELSYGLSGSGNTQHIVMLRIGMQKEITWKAVPFKSGPEAIAACLGKHITMMAGVTEWVPQVKSGDMRLLVVFGDERMKEFPNVPTLKELGYDITAGAFLGFGGPAGIPDNIVSKIDNEVAKAIREPQFTELMDKMLFPIHYMGHREFAKHIKDEYKKQGEVIQAAGLGLKKP